MRRAFTFIEVLAIVLVLGLGLMSVLALFSYGLRLSGRAQAACTAMATAMSVAVDDAPLIDPASAQWARTSVYAFDAAAGTAEASGYLNGYYVVRRETTVAADIHTGSIGSVRARSVQVDADVYDAQGGEVLASFTTRFVRTGSGP